VGFTNNAENAYNNEKVLTQYIIFITTFKEVHCFHFQGYYSTLIEIIHFFFL